MGLVMSVTADLDSLRRTAKVVGLLAWGVAGTIMVYGIPIVYRFLTAHEVPKQTAWLLSIAVDGALAVGLVATPILARYGVKSGWVGVLRWVAGFATWALNTAESWLKSDGPDIGGVFSHTWGPLMMFFAVEGAAYFQRKIAEVIRDEEAKASAADESARREQQQRAEEIRRLRAEAEDAARKAAAAEAQRRAEEAARRKAEERAAMAERRAEDAAEEARKTGEALRRVTADAEQSAGRYRQALAEVQSSARDARAQAAQACEAAAKTAGQLEEARAAADHAKRGQLAAEQQLAAVMESRQAVAGELERVSAALARLQRRAEESPGDGVRKNGTSSAVAGRKRVPALPGGVPPVEGVTPELVAAVLTAFHAEPDATRKRIAELAGTSDRTVRTVLNNLPSSYQLVPVGSVENDEGNR